MALPEVYLDNIVDLAAAYGVTLTTDQVQALPVLIRKAQDLLPVATETWITAGRLSGDTVASIVEDMVVRVVRNPRAFRQVSIDDFSATVDNTLSSGALYLSPDELERLTPGARSGRQFGTFRLGLESHRVPRC